MRPHSATRPRLALGLMLASLVALGITVHLHHGATEGATDGATEGAAGKIEIRHAVPVGGCTAAAARPHDIAAGAQRLEGWVVDDHHRTVGGARVTLDGLRTIMSAADGSFAFPGLAAGDHALTVEHGLTYGEQRVTLDSAVNQVEPTLRIGPTLVVHVVDPTGAPVPGAKVVAPDHLDAFTGCDGRVTVRGDHHPLLRVTAPGRASSLLAEELGEDPRDTVERTVVLGATAPIGGIVVDQNGAPVRHAEVTVAAVDGSWDDSVATDDAGWWQIAGFRTGRLRLFATARGAFSAPAAQIAFDARVPRFDLVLDLDRGGTINGVILGRDGRPAPFASVYATTSLPTHHPIELADERGQFSLTGVPPGDVQLEVMGDVVRADDRTVHMSRRGHADVVLHLIGSEIAGTVTNLRGEPVANASVLGTGPGTVAGTTDRAGHFVLTGVAPGDHALTVVRDSALDRDIARANDHSVPAHTGDRGVALVLPDAGYITGRVVRNGRPVEFFGVAADPALTPEPHYAPDGRFTLEVQTATEWPEQRYLVFVGPGFERRVLDGGVFAGSAQTTDLGDVEVSEGKTLRGRVVGPTGAPIAGATVAVTNGYELDDDLSLRHQNDVALGAIGVHSDASGQFEIGGLPDDVSRLTIQASRPDLGRALPRALTIIDLASGVDLALTPAR